MILAASPAALDNGLVLFIVSLFKLLPGRLKGSQTRIEAVAAMAALKKLGVGLLGVRFSALP